MIRIYLLPLLLLTSGQVIAAAPSVDFFYPAGGQVGTTVTVQAEGKFERWPAKVWSDSKHLQIEAGKTSGQLLITIGKDAAPGIHWIRLHDADGASVARPFIVGTLPEHNEKEPNDEVGKAQAFASSTAVINARLEKPGDVDIFAVPLKKGQTLVAAVEAFHVLRSPMDAILQVLSPEGFVLEQNHDYRDLDPQVAFTVPKDGLYLVRVFAFPSVPNSAIRFAGAPNFVYRLTLTTAGFVDYAFPLAVPRDEPATVELIGWNIPDALRKIAVGPPDETGVVRISHPDLANVVDVRAEPHATLVSAAATQERPQTVTLPVTISSRFEKPGAVDVYEFTAKKGEKISFRIDARTLGFQLDPILQITEGGMPLGKPARATTLNTDPTLDFTVPREGKFCIEVHDLHRQAGPRHAYRLAITRPQPDFALKVAGDRFTLASGKPLDIPVTVDKLGGFKEDIEVTLEGVPDHVSAVSSATPKGISLRLTAAGTTPFSGPIRIVGKTASAKFRHAAATVVDTNATTRDLWLTVTGSPR